MIKENYLSLLDPKLKILVSIFVIVLSIGFFFGIRFIHITTESSSIGIIENYLGNEENEQATDMKFKKSRYEMQNIVHTHILSLSIIFFILGLLVYGSSIPSSLKLFLMLEPLVSVILTFGGIYLLWLGQSWCTIIIMVSGIVMTICYSLAVFVILRSIFTLKQKVKKVKS